MSGPAIALLPRPDDGIEQAIRNGGGVLAASDEADGIVWTDPSDPAALKEVLASSPARWVQLPFAGIESFFEAGAIDSEHTWTCTKGVYGPTTAEHALTLMLVAARRIHEHLRARTWVDHRFGPERRLAGAVVVIVGTGGIGTALTRQLEPLEARVIGVNRSGRPLQGAERTVTTQELVDVAPEADFIVVAAALTDETRGLIGERVLRAMKSDAWLVNVARGGLVDTGALVAALREKRIGGAALDVTDPEPLPDGHPLWDFDETIITPHVANTWPMALPELRAVVERNVRHFAAGEELEGLVEPKLGY